MAMQIILDDEAVRELSKIVKLPVKVTRLLLVHFHETSNSRRSGKPQGPQEGKAARRAIRPRPARRASQAFSRVESLANSQAPGATTPAPHEYLELQCLSDRLDRLERLLEDLSFGSSPLLPRPHGQLETKDENSRANQQMYQSNVHFPWPHFTADNKPACLEEDF